MGTPSPQGPLVLGWLGAELTLTGEAGLSECPSNWCVGVQLSLLPRVGAGHGQAALVAGSPWLQQT